MTEYRRYLCRDCVFYSGHDDYAPCVKQDIDVSGFNNICRAFEARIKNPSTPHFDFDKYLEFLGSDYYRPWGIDRTKIIGKVWGPVRSGLDRQGVWHTEYDWKPIYESFDEPYCRVNMPRAFVKTNDKNGIEHKFEIDYLRFRELKTIEDDEIKFVIHRWKDTPNQRKYNEEINGVRPLMEVKAR